MRRIVNIYNFIRALEPRDRGITPEVLYETVAEQVRLLRRHDLPATWALQYDALLDPRYQRLLREQIGPRDEIGAWWEIVQPQVEKAGLVWRGRYPWDWHAHVGFSPGYTPAERERLADVYMADFKAIFGRYPESVGSWFIDEHTLGYLAERYGVIASCNCKDQVGTDGYTLWGGYWNQAYYPSRVNAYMPAQDAAAQLPVPIFRMLGSDPIYQYDLGRGTARQSVASLEPVYGCSGSDPAWVRWFFDFTCHQPCLAFAYAQAGQENSFTWAKLGPGLTHQVELLAELVRRGELEVETLAASGRWFRQQFPVTPATAVVALDDCRHEGRRTVWYNSRYYRANLLWEPAGFRFRDLHLFDQRLASPYLTAPLTTTACHYYALPLLDGFHWSTARDAAGFRVVALDTAGPRPVEVGPPTVTEPNASTLRLACPLPGGEFTVLCAEDRLTCALPPGHALHFTWPCTPPPITSHTAQALHYRYHDWPYALRLRHGTVQPAPAGYLFNPGPAGLEFHLRAGP
jgi:hypothetical protein